LDRGLLVQREIVEHDDVARPQGRREDLLDVGEKGGIIERAVEDGGRDQASARSAATTVCVVQCPQGV
jgi:hypothetical protein